MEDYYSLLEVDQNADIAVIKRAYRKVAMKWHPDRHNQAPEAVAMFQRLVEAYECLTDPQERAWYDRHRAELLAGVRDRHGALEGAVDLDDYLTDDGEVRIRWSNFEDRNPKSFFFVVQSVFNGILADEAGAVRVAAIEAGLDPDREVKKQLRCPHFGDSKTPWSHLAEWYGFWESFETRKTFAFADLWDPDSGYSSWVRKAARSENREARAAAKKKFGKKLRAILQIVMDNDPRYQDQREKVAAAQAAAQAAEHARVRALEEAAEAKRAAERAAARAADAEALAHVNKAKELGLGLEEYCRLHKVDVSSLGAHGALLGVGETRQREIEEVWAEFEGKGKAKSKSKSGAQTPATTAPATANNSDNEDSDDEVEVTEEDKQAGCIYTKSSGQFRCSYCKTSFKNINMFRSHAQSRKHVAAQKAALKSAQPTPAPSAPATPPPAPAPAAPPTPAGKGKGKGKGKKGRNNHDFDDEFDAAPAPAPAPAPKAEAEAESWDEPGSNPRKNARRAAKKAEAQANFRCEVCKAGFDTRNALFTHIRSTGHAAYK